VPVRGLAAVALGALCAAALSACGAAHPANPRTGRRVAHVVAGENVWGDIAAQVGGTHVVVHSILHDPNADPELYESTPKDAVAVQTANLVIANGGGYDDFMNRLIGASSGKSRAVLSVAHVIGAPPDPNPHFWYDLATARRVADAIAAQLARADPRDAAQFRARAQRFKASLAPIAATLGQIAAADANTPVAYTEPVPQYMVKAARLDDATPTGFARAVEDGNDPGPGDSSAMTRLISGRRIRALLYNAQDVTPVTKDVRAAATKAGIPVVAVTETLPLGLHYQAWQQRQDRALQAALSRPAS
jgi:zinc/manganese transport system substrate-binding protein